MSFFVFSRAGILLCTTYDLVHNSVVFMWRMRTLEINGIKKMLFTAILPSATFFDNMLWKMQQSSYVQEQNPASYRAVSWVIVKLKATLSAFWLSTNTQNPYFFLPLFTFSASAFFMSFSWPAPWSAKWAVQDQWRAVGLQRWEHFPIRTWEKVEKQVTEMYINFMFSYSLLDWLRCGSHREGTTGYSCVYWCDFICHREMGWCHSKWGQRQEWWHCAGETLLHLWRKSWDIREAVPG